MPSLWLAILIVALVGSLSAPPAKAEELSQAPFPSENSLRGTAPGATRDDNGLKMKFVWCPPGAVTMEDVVSEQPSPVRPKEKPKISRPEYDDDVGEENPPVEEPVEDQDYASPGVERAVRVKAFLRQGYWLGKFEVTQAEWKRLMGTEPWKDKETTRSGDDYPVTYVDWNDANQFCRKFTEQERSAGRLPDDWEYTLPTEAQWERACRARTETKFSFGDDDSQFGEFGWCIDNTVNAGEDYAHRVGQKKPNAWGLHDMHGNVWEWCRDTYRAQLPGGRDPEVKDASPERVLRGGGIYRHALECRSSFRNNHKPDWRLYDLGFRVALSHTGIRR